MNDNIKLILGAGGGVLVLTGFIILFIFLRRKRNKKIDKANQSVSTETTAAREQENLISNPTFSNMSSKEAEVDTNPGVEMLHYPRNSIEQTEILENGKDSIWLCFRLKLSSMNFVIVLNMRGFQQNLITEPFVVYSLPGILFLP